MSKKALTKNQTDSGAVESGEAFERRVADELNAQHEELRDQARSLFATVKGRRGIRNEKDWEALFHRAKVDYESGRFLMQRLGADRYLEPDLMATLVQLRTELLAGIENPSAADRMMADSAIVAYRNMLLMQGWIGNLCLVVERELFGQEPLNEIHGHTVGDSLEKQIASLEHRLMPLLDRCQRMMARSFAYLDAAKRKLDQSPIVAVGQAGQVNVDSAVLNKTGG